MTLQTVKRLWLVLGLTPLIEAMAAGADRRAIEAGVVFLLGGLLLRRAARRDPRGEVFRAFARTRIAAMTALAVLVALQLFAGLLTGRGLLVGSMGLAAGLFALWGLSRTGRELTAQVASVLLLAATLGVLGIVGEVALIVLEPYLFRGFYEYDRELGFRVRAHQPTEGGRTNAFGFNDRDYPERKDPGVFRVLVAGDSFGWAGGLDQNYTAMLERTLEDHFGGHRVDIINAGYPMTHTAQQLAMLEKYGLRYDPDLVVLGFFVGNDFIDANPDRKRIVLNDTYINIDPAEERWFLGYPIVPQSRLLLFLRQKWKVAAEFGKAAARSRADRPPRAAGALARTSGAVPVLAVEPPRPTVSTPTSLASSAGRPQRGVDRAAAPAGSARGEAAASASHRGPKPAPPAERAGFFSEATFLALERAKLEFFKVGPARNPRFQRNVDYIFRSIDAMNALLKARNARFIVAIYPDEFQVDPRLFRQIVDRFKLSERDYDLRLAQKILTAYLDSREIEYVDFTDRFAAAAESENLYLPRDTHWNRAGNRLAADILFSRLIGELDGDRTTPRSRRDLPPGNAPGDAGRPGDQVIRSPETTHQDQDQRGGRGVDN